MAEKTEKYLLEFPQIFKYIDGELLEQLSELLIRTHGRIFLCGNGGSSCTAQHISEDLALMCGLDTQCLTDNTGYITALANDISYDDIFSEQLKRMGSEKDILIVISGSGNSKNIIKAVDTAKKIGMFIIAIVGTDGGKLKKKNINDIIHIKTDMQHFEDCSLIIGHMLALSMMR